MHPSLLRSIQRCPRPVPHFVLPGTFIILFLPGPHTLLLSLGPPFRLAVFLLQPITKLSTGFCFIHSRISCPQHLKAYISPKQSFPDICSCDNSAVLVYLVDVCTYAPSQNICGKPIERILGIGLRGSSKMSEFGRIDSGQTDVYLRLLSVRHAHLILLS